jgi:SAM-dependent methyltransferase
MPYPPELGARIVRAAGLGDAARALDVGCGPGPLTLLLAGSVREVVGADADAEMLTQARLAADRAGVMNASWRQIRAEELPADLGAFDLVTFAQSFHWMERERVAATVRGMLRANGACVHVGATTNRGDGSSDPLPRPRPPYEQILALVISFLGSQQRAGRSAAPRIVAGSEIPIYRRAGFGGPLRVEVERGEVVERSVEEIVAATFSLSSSTPSLLGADRERFEAELTELLVQSSDDGLFCERLRDVTFDVWRPR